MKEFSRLTRQYSWLALQYRLSLASVFWVKSLKRKMTISRELERSTKRLKMSRGHNNDVQWDASVRFERGALFLLQMLSLFVRWTIYANRNKSSYLGNESFNDKARTCPEHGRTL